MTRPALKLSILDQSAVRQGDTPHAALNETIRLARLAERLGYHRFWVSEHHSTPMLAGSSPEVLLGALGAHTQRIRLGSGGVMLPHYSPYKVAENFAVLDALYPGRVDLGIGRAPGSDMVAARALARDGQPRFGDFPEQARELYERLILQRSTPPISPASETRPELWMLGSSIDSAILAAEMGLPYNLAVFINDGVSPQVTRTYRERFKASPTLAEPYVTIAIRATVADSTEEAERIARSASVAFVRFLTKQGDPRVPSPEDAARHVFSRQEEAFLAARTSRRVAGDPVTASHQLMELAETFDADEVMLTTISYSLKDRIRSYTLMARQLGLLSNEQ